MPFTRGRGRANRGSQSGLSLIEALVASALLGIVAMVGLTGWDTAIMSADKAVRMAWAQCMARSELDAILAAPWSSTSYPSPDPKVVVTLVPNPHLSSPGQGEEQLVLVRVFDPRSGDQLFQAAALKVVALHGDKPMDDTVMSDVRVGCPAP